MKWICFHSIILNILNSIVLEVHFFELAKLFQMTLTIAHMACPKSNNNCLNEFTTPKW